MKPAQLRKWIRQYGNFGVLMVAGYMGLHFLWTKRRLPVIMLLFVVVGNQLIWSRPKPRCLSIPPPPDALILSPSQSLKMPLPEAQKINAQLLLAVQQNHLEGVKAALSAGADVNFTEGSIPKLTALDYAQQEGHQDIVKLLQQAGAKNSR